jgi:DNA-binding NarL/FixJ family response regulator
MAGMRVVIAEDSALLREGLVRLLEDRGYEVDAAVGDASSLLAAVAEHHPDVVVTDIRMPRRAKPGTQIRCATLAGCAAVSASSTARTLSPASSSRFSAATAAITCVESVRCLPPALTSPPAASLLSSASSTTCSSPESATRPRNSASTV